MLCRHEGGAAERRVPRGSQIFTRRVRMREAKHEKYEAEYQLRYAGDFHYSFINQAVSPHQRR